MNRERVSSPEHEKLPWSVRRARPEDAKELAQLQSRLWQETYMRPGQDERNDYIFAEAMGYLDPLRIEKRAAIIDEVNKDSSLQSYLVLEGQPGQIVGLLYGVHTADEQEIVALYVDSVYQGEGGGRGLIEAFMRDCDSTRPIQLGVIDDNFNAQGFYKKLGFEVVPGSLHPFNEYMDEIMMICPAG